MTAKDIKTIQSMLDDQRQQLMVAISNQGDDMRQFTLATVSQAEARLEDRMEEIIDRKLEEKLEEMFAVFRDEIVSGVNQTIEPILDLIDNHEYRIRVLEAA